MKVSSAKFSETTLQFETVRIPEWRCTCLPFLINFVKWKCPVGPRYSKTQLLVIRSDFSKILLFSLFRLWFCVCTWNVTKSWISQKTFTRILRATGHFHLELIWRILSANGVAGHFHFGADWVDFEGKLGCRTLSFGADLEDFECKLGSRTLSFWSWLCWFWSNWVAGHFHFGADLGDFEGKWASRTLSFWDTLGTILMFCIFFVFLNANCLLGFL